MAEEKKKGGGKPAAKGAREGKASLYKVEGASLKRLRSACPKCGPGIFLGQHKDRVSCGHCGYTEFTKK